MTSVNVVIANVSGAILRLQQAPTGLSSNCFASLEAFLCLAHAPRAHCAGMLCALADGGRWSWTHPKLAETALHAAARQGHSEAVRTLLEAGAYVHAEDGEGNAGAAGDGDEDAHPEGTPLSTTNHLLCWPLVTTYHV